MEETVKAPSQIEVVAGILKLTLDNKLVWTRSDSIPSKQLSTLAMGAYTIQSVYEADYDSSIIRLIGFVSLSKGVIESLSGKSLEDSFKRFDGVLPDRLFLYICAPDGNVIYRFQESEVINDLFRTVQQKASNLGPLFQRLARAATS